MRYRRADVTGGTYFFTVNLAERSGAMLVEKVDLLRQVHREVKLRHPFHIDAMVILPDHLHAMWTLPEGDADYPTRWMLIKAGFSRHIAKGERCRASRIKKGERGIWQRRYWKHLIRDDRDYERHANTFITTPANTATLPVHRTGPIQAYTGTSRQVPWVVTGGWRKRALRTIMASGDGGSTGGFSFCWGSQCSPQPTGAIGIAFDGRNIYFMRVDPNFDSLILLVKLYICQHALTYATKHCTIWPKLFSGLWGGRKGHLWIEDGSSLL